MAIFKVNKTKDYTIMSNYHLQEKEMSLKAKGLLSMMLSLPESWDYSIDGLVAICKESESAIISTLRELKEFGYLRIDKLMPNQTKSGRIEYVYNIYEAKQGIEKQGVENQGLVFRGLEELKTNKSNTNNNIIINIVGFLNSTCGTSYKPTTPKTQTLIKARLNEHFTEDDFKTVIEKMSALWKGTEMEKYLRPETLFGTKFESYLNAKVNEKPKATSRDYTEREYTQEEMSEIFQDINNFDNLEW